MKILITNLVFVSTLCFSIFSIAEDSELRHQVRKGVDLLYSNQVGTANCADSNSCPENIDKEALIEQALKFKQNYDQIISNYKLNGLVWHKPANHYDGITKFEFKSPIQKDGSLANTVYGYLYKPDIPAGCAVKLPATVLVHHVANEIDDEKLFASLATKMNKGIIMIIYLPEYGPRKKNKTDPPFSNDMNEFKNSLLQSLMDIRIAGEILKTVEGVDTKKMQVGGLSLGALLTTIFAGLDSFFDNHFIGLGGGDLSNALTIAKNKQFGAVKDALVNIDWNKDQARKILSDFDALTWAYTVKNKKFVFISADDDELVDKEKSVRKLISAYREKGNKVNHYEHKGTHVPDAKTMGYTEAGKSYFNVIYSVFSFFGDNRSAEIERCRNNNVN